MFCFRPDSSSVSMVGGVAMEDRAVPPPMAHQRRSLEQGDVRIWWLMGEDMM